MEHSQLKDQMEAAETRCVELVNEKENIRYELEKSVASYDE